MAKRSQVMRVGFIGSGQLAERIARKLVTKVTPQRKFCYKKQRLVSTLLASDPSHERRQVFDQLGFTTTDQNHEILVDCDVVFIGTNPRSALEGVFPLHTAEATSLREKLKSKLFVTLMGDMPAEKVEGLLYPGAKVIRMMPQNYLEHIGFARGLLPPSSWATTRNAHASADDVAKIAKLTGISTCIEVDDRSTDFWAFTSGYSLSTPASAASTKATDDSGALDDEYPMEEVDQDFHEQYVVGEYLGTGRFAKVYKATHRESARVFAVKSVTDAELTQEARDTLIAEVAALSHLSHPNVIAHHGFFSEQDNYYLLLDYCDKGSVRRLLRTHKRVNEASAKSIIRQLLLALEYCHAKGVVHRDVKAENVLLSSIPGKEEEYHVQLADFGLSKELDLVSGYLQDMCGTPQYLSPEIVSGRTYAQPADIWSAGILSYMLLCGRVPFDNATSEAELFRDIRIGAIWYHQAEWKDVSPEAKDFVQRMLEVSPASRSTASVLLAHKWLQQ